MMDFKDYFIRKWPEEAVGYLKDGAFHPLENISEGDKRRTFKVDESFLLSEPDALLHSHTTGSERQDGDPRSPSAADLECQIATDIEWGICVTDGENCEEPLWWGNPANRPPLEGREFIFNIQDCLSLCQDWFYADRGLVLPNQPRNPFWNQEGEDHIGSLYKNWGFRKVALDKLKHGDVLFYQVRSPVINHLGIYLGDNQVLSHWYGRTSCVEDFGVWARYIQFAGRHK
jgi:hypothetical protein